jgi:hypothetical protein
MPLPTDAELPPIYHTGTPGGTETLAISVAGNAAERGDLSALLIRSLIKYARERGLTDLEQISDEFIAEWRRPHSETLRPPDGYCYQCKSADLCPACRNDMIS